MPVRTIIERGPKGKRSVAFALDWPGWNRGAKTPELALETLESYRERYRPVADLAGMASEFDAAGPLEIVEDRIGSGMTDFYGLSFSSSSTEHDPMDEAELDRKITLLQASWAFFDGVAARVSPELRKGPRGGGRDRNLIVAPRHPERERGVREAGRVADPGGGRAQPGWPAAVSDRLRRGMRARNAGEIERRPRAWTLSFLIRHSAYHTLDHAWEMEDKDLSAERTGLNQRSHLARMLS